MRSRDALDPCKVCKLRRKKCVRRFHNTKCDRCSSLQMECTPYDNSSILEEDSLMAHDGNLEVQNWQADVNRLDSELQQLATMKTNLRQVATTQQESDMVWELCITNGVVRLNTPIKTMDELLMFTHASIRYLSPFTGIFKREPLRFESTYINISFGLTSMIQRRELLKPRKKRFTELEYNIKYTAQDDFRAIMNHIIPLYLSRYICVMGLLHVPTFLKYYHSLDDPLNDAMVLAVCIDALVNLRYILDYPPIKKRILAETLYIKCKDLLFDLYDDPKRKLEVIFTTSFLQTYMRDVTLNSLESGRLITVALVLCAEMQNDTSIKMTTIQSVLLQRHCLYLEASNRLYHMIHEGKIDFTLPKCVPEVGMLDDEPEETKNYLKLYNHLLRLLGSPYVANLMGETNNICLGKPCELLLEDVLLVEHLVTEWWSSLPKEFCLCDDPFDPKMYQLVKRSLPAIQLYPFAVVHMLICAIYGSTLQPSVLSTQESTAAIDVIQSVRKRLISVALNSCKALIHALEMNWNIDTSDTPSFSFGVILYSHYCLEKIAYCKDIPFPQDLLDLFKNAVDIKLRSVVPVGHEVPPSLSLAVTSLESSKVSPYDVYEQYPFAGDALIVDVIRTSISQLDKYLSSLH